MHSKYIKTRQNWLNRTIAMLYVLLAAFALFLPLPVLFRTACLSLLCFVLFNLFVRHNRNRWLLAARVAWALATTLLFVLYGLSATGRL